MKRDLLFLIVSSLISIFALQALECDAAFVTGNQLVQFMREFDKYQNGNKDADNFEIGRFTGYVIGVVDSNNESAFLIPTDTSIGQIGAIVSKYLKDHPEKWNEPASILVITALKEAFPLQENK